MLLSENNVDNSRIMVSCYASNNMFKQCSSNVAFINSILKRNIISGHPIEVKESHHYTAVFPPISTRRPFKFVHFFLYLKFNEMCIFY